MGYCEKCRQQNDRKSEMCECDYDEIKMFLDYLDGYLGKQFEIIECPDKNPDNKGTNRYTCDFVLREKNTAEIVYIEVKRVLYGYDNPENTQMQTAEKKGNSHDNTIAQDKGQKKYVQLISSVIDKCYAEDDDKQDVLWKFMITVPQMQIGSKDYDEFCSQLHQFITENTFEEDKYCFTYERKEQEDEIKIIFTRKTDKEFEMFDEDIGFQCDMSGDKRLSAVIGRMMDADNMRKLMKKNANETTHNKFPKTQDRKILLNILRLPQGFELFFDTCVKKMMTAVMENPEDYRSAADECYLLYYSSDYCDTDFMEDGSYRIKFVGNSLLIFPLIKGLIEEPTNYIMSDN